MIKQLASRMDQLATHNKILENQIGQQVSSSGKAVGKLPSQIEMNPKEHCKEVTLRSGRVLKQSEEEPTEKTSDKFESQAEEMVLDSKTNDIENEGTNH